MPTVIHSFDDFVQEAAKLPDLSRAPIFHLDPLEAHFFSVADKHGVIDEILDPETEIYFD